MIENLNIIFPNQLFENSPLLKNQNESILVEEFLFFNQFKFHKQKILFHRITMKNYQQFLEFRDKKVKYIEKEFYGYHIHIEIKGNGKCQVLESKI